MQIIGGNSAPGTLIQTNFLHVWTLVDIMRSFVGDAVVNVYINHEKKFAFVEMRTVEEASNAMALDGIMFEVDNWFLSFRIFCTSIEYVFCCGIISILRVCQ